MPIPLLDLQQCSVRFGGLTAVSAFDLQISADDLIGLIGPNGAGKKTVFNVVTGVYRPTAGAITFESASISGLRSEEHTSEFQSHGLISYAVFCLKKKKRAPHDSFPSRRLETYHPGPANELL